MPLFQLLIVIRQIEGETLRIGRFSFTIAIKLVLVAFIEREMC